MGRLIVIEGLDGSGKTTQTERVAAELRSRGEKVRVISYPDYQNPSSMLVRMYLSGAFGSRPGDVNAYAASAFYAVDRYASYKQDWGEYYEQGGILITDRYTTSNVLYLDLPFELSEALIRQRAAQSGQTDIHETDGAYLRQCRENAQEVVRLAGWRRVDCQRNGSLRTAEDIHEEVYSLVRPLLG